MHAGFRALRTPKSRQLACGRGVCPFSVWSNSFGYSAPNAAIPQAFTQTFQLLYPLEVFGSGLARSVQFCREHSGNTREEMTHSRRSESRKVCIYLIKRHTSATNAHIAELFGSLSYSAVAKINGNVSKKLLVDKELRDQIKRLQLKYSFLTPCSKSVAGGRSEPFESD